MSNYDDLLPVSLHQTKDYDLLILDRHNDVVATFDAARETEECQRIIDLINRGGT